MSVALEFKNYRIINEVGSGGLGKVFRAVDLRTGRMVAIKILHKKYQTSRRFLGIFHRELLTIASLKHKSIVEFLDSNFEPPNCYIVTEFVDGWSLYSLMKQFGSLPPLIALCMGIDILQGIDYLHLHDTVHSDLSAPNVLIDKTGRVLVTDFGLAIQTGIEDYKDCMIGTPGYYSPEHITQAAIIPASDIYCVGLLIFEMVTGRKAVPPAKERNDIVRLMKNINFGAVVIHDRSLQRAVVNLLKGALQFNESRRINSTELMMFEVYKILKKNHIRFTRLAIRQFLADAGVAAPGDGPLQDIYIGRSHSKKD